MSNISGKVILFSIFIGVKVAAQEHALPQSVAAEDAERIGGVSVVAGAPGDVVYSNVINPITSVYMPGLNQRMADDMHLAASGCSVTHYEIGIVGLCSLQTCATFDVAVELWDGDPCDSNSRIIDGTELVFYYVPRDNQPKIAQVTFDTPIAIPDKVWMSATFTNANAGWLIAGPAEVGSTQNIFSENDNTLGCDQFFLQSNYAGFWAEIRCELAEPLLGACCNLNNCTLTTEPDCTNGIWQGASTGCTPSPCDDSALCTQPELNCQAPAQQDAVTSDGSEFVVADDFTPSASGDVTSICFWGAYIATIGGTDCAGVSPDNFIVRYYDSVDGRPGALLATYSQSGGTLVVTGPEPTGLNIAAAVPEYEFTAAHAAVPVTAGSCYWIEITNEIPGCDWFWELSNVQNQRAFQDGRNEASPDGYDPEETIVADLAFCVGLPLGDSAACYPPAPPNDDCADAIPLNAAGDVVFDISSATQDGPAHAACSFFLNEQIAHDVWYCWTSPCTATAFARTCGSTSTDTKIAVYEGCACPPAEADILACNDDLCGAQGLQSMVTFEAVQGQSYLIRLGTYANAPGGGGILQISCGAPENQACPGSGSCCDAQESAGCEDQTCCETVCACDAYCCDFEWDVGCATTGFGGSGCGADALCGCGATCGSANAGDCCTGHDTPACSNAECCETVCECDSYCCETEWDAFCAGQGSIPGCGAEVLCGGLCGDVECLVDADCDDGVACTIDTCDSMSGTCTQQTDDALCDDGSFCNGQEVCTAGGCQPGQAVVCDDGVACTVDTCDQDADACMFQPQHSLCDDGVACTVDTCTASGCSHNPGSCGACCLSDRSCAGQLSEAECAAMEGSFLGGGSACAGDANGDAFDDACGLTPIPSVSEWGLLAMALCLLIVSKVYALRRSTG